MTSETSTAVDSNPNKADMAHQSNVVRGAAESMLNHLESNINNGNMIDEDQLLQSSEPGPLGKESKEVEEVLNIISQSIFKEAEGQFLMKLSDRTSLLSVVSHSLSAYITTLEPNSLQRLSGRIAHEVGLWMCKLFKFTDGAAYCHDDTREGLVKIARLALHKKYPRMSQDGFEALFSRPPVIYLTSSTYQDTMAYVCRQLGLPQSTVKLLKLPQSSSENEPLTGKAVEEELAKIMNEDKAAGKLPILCVANVHSSLIQHSMTITAFEQVCRKMDIWLHIEGNALAGLILVKNENNRKSMPTGDSMALTLGSWIGVPAVPFVTLYKTPGTEIAASAAGLTTLNPSVRLNCLPLWSVLRSLGELQIQERIESLFQMLEVLNSKLSEFKCLRVLSQRSPDDKFVPVAELMKKDFDVSKIYRTVNPALAFQFVSDNPPTDRNQRVPDYFNNLNSWLGQTMQRDCPQVPLEIVDVETTGYVLRLCPFESLAFSGVALTDDDLASFVEGIELQTSILNATVIQREKFLELITQEIRLENVNISNWAGLGGVRYIPSDFIEDQDTREVDAQQVRNNLEKVKDENRDLIDHRNIQLVHHLRNSDSAFSLGEGADGRICIRFGMVSMETDVEELLKLVMKSGLELDEQLAQLQNMSEVIQKGIAQAQGELQKESEEAIWQEGILRHVPLVGSFYNWISPVQKPQIKGRCLSLQEGKLESTENIYKATPPKQNHDQDQMVPNGIENPALTTEEDGTQVEENANEEEAKIDETVETDNLEQKTPVEA